jgi:fluoride exporter
LGTLLINVTGAFAIGLLFALAGRKIINSAGQGVLATGFLGGYTTFSTMSWEGVQLVRGGSTKRGLLYLAGNVIVGLIAVVLGLVLGWWL